MASSIAIQPVGWKDLTSPAPPPLPSVRSGHTLVVNRLTSECFLFGGLDGLNCLNDLHVMTLQNDFSRAVWTEIDSERQDENRPSPRASHCACACGGEGMFVFGGVGETYASTLNDAYWFDFSTRKWSRLTNDAPATKIVRMETEGHSTTSFPYGHGCVDSEVFFKPVAGSIEAGYGYACTYDATNDCVLMFGGTRGPNEFFNQLYVFHRATESWWVLSSSSTSTPSPRYLSKLALLDNDTKKLLVFGGGIPHSCLAGSPMEVFEFNLNTLQWSQVSTRGDQVPGSRFAFAFVELHIPGRFLIHGGLARAGVAGNQQGAAPIENARVFTDKVYHDDAWVFDYTSKTWSTVAATERGEEEARPGRLNFHAAVPLRGGKDVLFFGGFSAGVGRNNRTLRLRLEGYVPPLEHMCQALKPSILTPPT